MIALPFERLYSEVALISLVLHTLLHIDPKKMHVYTWNFLLCSILFFLTVADSLYSVTPSAGFSQAGRQAAIILFPLVFGYSRIDLSRSMPSLLFGLAVSCAVVVIYLYVDALTVIRYFHLPFNELFSGRFIHHNFSEPIGLHATYFSMYIVMGMIAPVRLLLQRNQSTIKRPASIALTIVLLAGLVQLASRSVLIAFVVIISAVIPLMCVSGRKKWIAVAAGALLSATGILFLTMNKTFEERYVAALRTDLTNSVQDLRQAEPRAVRWECGWELIRQSPVIGHGSGSEISLLRDVYFQKGYYHSFLQSLNVHNQYLSCWIQYGIVGLIVFLLVLLFGFRKALLTKDVFFCSFLVLTVIVSFSEDMLDVNKGIFFFAFFYAAGMLGKKPVSRPLI